MGDCAAMLIGRALWLPEGEGWRRAAPATGDAGALQLLCEVARTVPIRELSIVYEPDSLSHQSVETPKVRREVFASLARVRSEHPVVASEDLGWGIEPPEPGPGGAYLTQIHSEFAPGLVELAAACDRFGRRLAAAWSAYTVAAQCLKSRGGPRAGTAVILADGHVAVAACGAKRSYAAWNGAMTEKDWRAFRAAVGEPEARQSPGPAQPGPGRRGIVAIADGDPQQVCPQWEELRASGRIEAVVGMEEFAAAAGRMPASHPANLASSFPRRLDLDRGLTAGAAAFLAAALAFGTLAASDNGRLRRESEAGRARVEGMEARLNALESNKRQMARLMREAPEPAGRGTAGVHETLVGLAAAIPETLMLTSLDLRPGGEFEIGAEVVAPGFEQDGARQALASCGLRPSAGGGWSYDPAAGRLRVRGRWGGPQR
jgi:hypothetical protein